MRTEKKIEATEGTYNFQDLFAKSSINKKLNFIDIKPSLGCVYFVDFIRIFN